jgi:hypothetical protein
LATERTTTSGKIVATRRFGMRTISDENRLRGGAGAGGRAKRAKGSVERSAMEWRTEGSQSSTTLDCDPGGEDSALARKTWIGASVG